jgi:hypothetical protein
MCIMNAYHKFVKTTPKPSATKNRSGDEVGPVPTLFVGLLEGDCPVVGDGDPEDIDIVVVEASVGVVWVDWVSRSKT